MKSSWGGWRTFSGEAMVASYEDLIMVEEKDALFLVAPRFACCVWKRKGETAFSHSSRSRTPLKARALSFVCANDVCIRPAGAYVIPPPAMGTMMVPFCEK